MLDDRLIAFSSTFALLCAVILARVASCDSRGVWSSPA